MIRVINRYCYAVIAVFGLLLFIPFLGTTPLFDWDEINFAEAAREMILTKDFFTVQINFHPFWEKPPLFIWMQVLSMKVFGVNEFAARFPNAIFGIITLLTIFHLAKKYFKLSIAWFWMLFYAASFLPHLYFKSGIIDPVFNYFIFMSFWFLYRTTQNRTENNLAPYLLSGLFAGLAVLTKGPVGLLIILLTAFAYLFINKFRIRISFKGVASFIIVFLCTIFFWFGSEVIRNGPWFLVEFIHYQIRLFLEPDAGHGGPFYFHFIVLLFGCFPASVFLFGSFAKSTDENDVTNNFRKLMLILLAVVLILFSIVTTKIIHYSSLAYFPITFLAALSADRILKSGLKISMNIFFVLTGLIFSAAIVMVPFLFNHPEKILQFIHDEFSTEILLADVPWSGAEILPGLLLLISTIVVFLLFSRKKVRLAFTLLFIHSIIVIQASVIMIVPKIELHSQHATIEFYQSLKNEDCYVNTVGFKSYAHLFYSGKEKSQTENSLLLNYVNHQREVQNKNQDWPDSKTFDQLERTWQLTGEIDKNAYFVSKISSIKNLEGRNGIVELSRKNGFVFWKREPH